MLLTKECKDDCITILQKQTLTYTFYASLHSDIVETSCTVF